MANAVTAPVGAFAVQFPAHGVVFVHFPNGLVRHLLAAEVKAYGDSLETFSSTDEVDFKNYLALANAVQATPIVTK